MNRAWSIYSQILQLFPRGEFAVAVQQHKAERHARGFTCWSQFTAMLFCQLRRAPPKSPLADANRRRPSDLYQTVFTQLFQDCRTLADGRQRKFRFKNQLVSLDPTAIDLFLSLYDGAHYRRSKDAVLNVMYLALKNRAAKWATVQDSKRALNHFALL